MIGMRRMPLGSVALIESSSTRSEAAIGTKELSLSGQYPEPSLVAPNLRVEIPHHPINAHHSYLPGKTTTLST